LMLKEEEIMKKSKSLIIGLILILFTCCSAFGLSNANSRNITAENKIMAVENTLPTIALSVTEQISPTPTLEPSPTVTIAPTPTPLPTPTKAPKPKPTAPIVPAKKELLGGVKFLSAGMPISVYNNEYSPEKVDVDGEYAETDVDLNRFYRYSEIEAIILKLGLSTNVEVFKIGTTADSRNIYSLEIGTGAEKHLFVAGVHALEVCNPLYILKYAAWIVNLSQSNNEEVINLLKTKRICIVVVVNPDGFDAAIWGNSTITNRSLFIAKYSDSELSMLKSNANGVNLNRNFPSYSGGVIYTKQYRNIEFTKSPGLVSFTGYTLGVEPETQAMIKWYKHNLPDAKTFVDLHSRGRILYAGKLHLSDQLNSSCQSLAKIAKGYTSYGVISASLEVPGKNESGTNTDFANEFVSGFVFNEELGRLVPPESDIYTLVKKYTKVKYSCKTISFETLAELITATKNPELQSSEWNGRRLQEAFFAICKT
ncbi:MAG: M14 family zinc carboxypeptidase, partial [bacterium]